MFVAAQFYARDADGAKREFDGYLKTLGTEYLDAVTFYDTERQSERDAAVETGGAMEVLLRARDAGKLRMIGVTSHQRPLAAEIAASGPCDLLMIRYNAAHRGAETEIFPVTEAFNVPVVAYTCMRWGALLETTPDDPPGFAPPPAREWYRFALANPAVAVTLMVPNGRAELDANLELLTTGANRRPKKCTLCETTATESTNTPADSRSIQHLVAELARRCAVVFACRTEAPSKLGG